ncbi:MAG: hypothetical protein ABIP29_04230, partial [Candidatus Eisenbacteria bacterium]
PDEAAREAAEALRLARVLKLPLAEANSHEILGYLALLRGDERAAEMEMLRSLALFREHGLDAWSSVLGLAVVEARRGDFRRGLAWMGAARKAATTFWTGEGQPHVDRFWTDLRGPLSDDEASAAMDEGGSLDLKTVVDELLARPLPEPGS